MKEEIKELYGAWKNEESTAPRIEENEIKTLIKEVNTLIGKKKQLARFKEPVLYLIRRTGEVNFYEDVPEIFAFKHSTGEIIEVKLHPVKKLRFNYADIGFTGYIHYEDAFLSEPQEPLADAQIITDYYKKALMDTKTYEEQRKMLKEKSGGKIGIILAVAVVIIAIAFGLNMIGIDKIIAAMQPAETIITNGGVGTLP